MAYCDKSSDKKAIEDAESLPEVAVLLRPILYNKCSYREEGKLEQFKVLLTLSCEINNVLNS